MIKTLWLQVLTENNLPQEKKQPDYMLSKDLIRSALENCFQLGFTKLHVFGGEPLLLPHLTWTLSQARSLGYGAVDISTNLLDVEQNFLDFARNNNVVVVTKLFSDRSRLHDRMVCQAGAWEKTLSNIELCLAKNIALRVEVPERKMTLESIEETVYFLEDLGVGDVRIVPETCTYNLCSHCWTRNICVKANGQISPCKNFMERELGSVMDGLLDSLARDRKTLINKN